MRFIRKTIPFEIDKDSESDLLSDRIVEGYASTFESPERHDSHGDIILPGAFKQAIDEHNAGGFQVKLFLRHERGIGVMQEMREDAKGLFVRARISETRDGDDALVLLRDGVLDSFSIGFVVENESDFEDLAVMTKWHYPVRAYKRVGLKESSLLEIPSNEFARVTQVRGERLTHYKARCARSDQRKEPLLARIAHRQASAKDDAALRLVACSTNKGARLGSLLDDLIEGETDEDTPRAEVVAAVANAAGIEPGTLGEIVNGSIDCPPIARLARIATALGVSRSRLVNAAEDDGCVYTSESSADTSKRCVKLGALVTKIVAKHVDDDYTAEDVVEFIAMSGALEIEALKEIMSGEAVEPARSALEAIAGALDYPVEILVKAIEDDGAALAEELDAEAVEVEAEVVTEDDTTEETSSEKSAVIEAAVAAFQDIIHLISCST